MKYKVHRKKQQQDYYNIILLCRLKEGKHGNEHIFLNFSVKDFDTCSMIYFFLLQLCQFIIVGICRFPLLFNLIYYILLPAVTISSPPIATSHIYFVLIMYTFYLGMFLQTVYFYFMDMYLIPCFFFIFHPTFLQRNLVLKHNSIAVFTTYTLLLISGQ